MRITLSALMIPAICLSLAAESTGRLAGKVVGKDGKPIANAVLKLERVDIAWTKEIKVTDKGTFIQVGLEPREFFITVSAPGFASTAKMKRKIPLADTLTENFTLFTMDEARAEGVKQAAASADPGEAREAEGSDAFNNGVSFYNEQKYAEALPQVETAYLKLKEAASLMKDPAAKAEVEAKVPNIERVYGICLAEVAKRDPERKALAAKAEPFLVAAFERNPKDQRVVNALVDVGTVKGDAPLTAKYQAALDGLLGPRPELAYNEAVNAVNKEQFKAAKEHLTKAIALDPNFADSYYLMGIVEFSLNNPKAARASFLKYQEKAPNGSKKAEVKEFLKELK